MQGTSYSTNVTPFSCLQITCKQRASYLCIYLRFRTSQQMGHVSKLLPVLYWRVFYHNCYFEYMFFVQSAICAQHSLTWVMRHFPFSLLYRVSWFPCQNKKHKTTSYFRHQPFIIIHLLAANVFMHRKELIVFPGSEQRWSKYCQSHLRLSFEITLRNNFFKNSHTAKNNPS